MFHLVIFCFWIFFHVVKNLIPILALWPISSSLWKTWLSSLRSVTESWTLLIWNVTDYLESASKCLWKTTWSVSVLSFSVKSRTTVKICVKYDRNLNFTINSQHFLICRKLTYFDLNEVSVPSASVCAIPMRVLAGAADEASNRARSHQGLWLVGSIQRLGQARRGEAMDHEDALIRLMRFEIAATI